MKSRGPLQTTCTGKHKLSRHRAMVRVYKLLREENAQCVAYQCEYCGSWHVGHKRREVIENARRLMRLSADEIPNTASQLQQEGMMATKTIKQKPEISIDDILGKKKGKPTRADITDVINTGIEQADEVAELLKDGEKFKAEMDKKLEGSIAYRLESTKDRLAEIQAEEGLEEGFRHGKVVFTARLTSGREKTDMAQFVQNLLKVGVSSASIKQCMDGNARKGLPPAKVTGDDYWVRDLRILKS